MGCVGLFWLTGCAEMTPSLEVEESVPVDGVGIAQRYQQDQTARRQGPDHWAVHGSLDLEISDQGRRNRIDLLGSGEDWIRFRVYGPFQQVVMELLATKQWLRWLDPQKKIVTQVPASAAGMVYLIGVPLAPDLFFQMLMGLAGSLSLEESLAMSATREGVTVLTLDGERITLDPVHGRVLARSGETVPGRGYHVVYGWPDDPPEAVEGPVMIMPERILVMMDKPQVRMEFIFKRWDFPSSGPARTLFDEEVMPGLVVHYPLGEKN